MTDLTTAFTRLVGIREPVVLGPMAGGLTTPALVAAVCEAGGLGGLGAHMVPPDVMRAAIGQIRELTDRPFAVNVLLAPFGTDGAGADDVVSFFNRFRTDLGLPAQDTAPPSPPWMVPDQLAVLEECRVPVWSFALGLDRDLIQRAHAAGAIAIGTATTVDEAKELDEAGVDAVVAQGAEAGGHRSTFTIGPDRQGALVGTLALVPQVVDAVDVPVVAAGGIMDGRGLAAALALGAGAAQLGTRFLLSSESGASTAYVKRLLEATEVDTVVTDVLTGRPTRTVRNRLIDDWMREGPNPLGWMHQAMAALDVYGAATQRDDGDFIPLQAGQGVGLARDVAGAGELLRAIVDEARTVIEGLGA